jgi:hypothetical protein
VFATERRMLAIVAVALDRPQYWAVAAWSLVRVALVAGPIAVTSVNKGFRRPAFIEGGEL